MPQFYYGARDDQGQRFSGVLNASTRDDALRRLRDKYCLVLKVEEVEPPKQLIDYVTGGRVKQDDILAFTHQLAATLDSGLSFGASMELLLQSRTHRTPMRKVIVDLAAAVSEGRPFSSALASRPDVFSELYVNMVKAGESTAKLPHSLRRMASLLEKRNRLRYELVGAVLYPALVLLCGILVAVGLLIYGAPVVEEMYASAGASLPWLSAVVFKVGRFMGHFAWLGGLCAVAAVVLLPYALRRPEVRMFIDRILMTRGLTKDLFQQAATSEAARTLSTLYSAGAPLIDALRLTGKCSGSPMMEELFNHVADEVTNGAQLGEPLAASPIFPPMAAGMITAGVSSGNLADMLEHVADHFEMRVGFALRSLTKLLEPFLVVAVGMIVGVIVAALGMPFMNIVAVF